MNPTPLITVGFSTTHDPGAWYALNALMEQCGALRSRIEWIVVDNSPKRSPISHEFQKHVRLNHKDVKYIRNPGPASSCLYKDQLFYEASAPIVVCMDSHVLMGAGAIRLVLDYFERCPDSRDMLMGTIHNASGHVHGTNQLVYCSEDYPVPENAEVHHGIVCRGGQFGVWVKDERALDPRNDPFEIQMNGTWFFSMRREAWPRFHGQFWGFGGNELYLMEQVRRNGGRVLNVPGLYGIHNFSKAHGSGYTALAEDKLRNYLVTGLELNRPDIYDATIDYFGRMYPEVIGPAKAAADRVHANQYDTMMHQWRYHGGDVGGSVPKPLFERLLQFGPEHRTIEFGCGFSTIALDRRRTNHTAIEHNARWTDRLRKLLRSPNTTLVDSPLVGRWYGWTPNGERYDLILVDGPPGSIGRHGCVDVVPDILAPGGTVMLDDTHREAEQQISDQLCERLGAIRERIPHGRRSFDVLTV